MSKSVMDDETRLDLLDVLDQLMKEHPSWRIGQMLTNVAFLVRQTETAIWDVENEEFILAARQHLERTAERDEKLAQAKQGKSAARQEAAV